MAGFLDTLKLEVKTWRLAQKSIAILHTVNPADGSITPVADGALGGSSGTGTILGQATGTITGSSQALTGVPTGAGWARIQPRGAGMSVRYDGVAATGAASEEQVQSGGTLVLESAAEIAGFRYIGLAGGTGSFSIVYRSY
jgi:hypothetical protein